MKGAHMPDKATITVNNGDTSDLHYGQTVPVSYTVDPQVAEHNLIAMVAFAVQGGNEVYGAGGWPAPTSLTFASGLWTSGAADVTVRVQSFSLRGGTKIFGEITFPVLA